MALSVEKQALLDEALSLGVPAKPGWTTERLQVAIVKARRETAAAPSRRTSLIQRATQLGLVVSPDWTDDQIQAAADRYEEAVSAPSVSLSPTLDWRVGSPRG